MTIIIDEKEYSFPDYTLNYLDYRDLDNRIKTKIPQDIFNSLLNDLDCTKEFSCGRPMMTNYPMYARNINAYFYILETLNYTENNDNWYFYIEIMKVKYKYDKVIYRRLNRKDLKRLKL